MDIEEVLQILGLLADGINPETHERIPSDSPYHQSSCVRALFHAINIIERNKGSEKRRASAPVNQGKPWASADDESLLKNFDEGVPVPELAKMYQRTVWAVQSRLGRLGRVDYAQGVIPQTSTEGSRPDGYKQLVDKVLEF